MTTLNSSHSALKYTWENSETSLNFLDIKVSIRGHAAPICQCVLQTYRFPQLFDIFIFSPTALQKLNLSRILTFLDFNVCVAMTL